MADAGATAAAGAGTGAPGRAALAGVRVVELSSLVAAP